MHSLTKLKIAVFCFTLCLKCFHLETASIHDYDIETVGPKQRGLVSIPSSSENIAFNNPFMGMTTTQDSLLKMNIGAPHFNNSWFLIAP
jgi:hypothetical protein